MKTEKYTNKVIRVTADEGKYLTSFDDEYDDILLYEGFQVALMRNEKLPLYHEITEEEHEAYELAKKERSEELSKAAEQETAAELESETAE